MNLKTRARSWLMRYMASERALEQQRSRGRAARKRDGHPPTVHYFHQVDDPYSHLVAQRLDALRHHYALRFEPHLVSAPAPEYQGNTEHFTAWARADAQLVAAHYGVEFAPGETAPSLSAIARANGTLARHLELNDFAEAAFDAGRALWAGWDSPGSGSEDAGVAAVKRGTTLRQSLGHYLGGMFYYEGEWFWGLDRARLLEARLREDGFGDPQAPLCVPVPAVPTAAPKPDDEDIVFEYFPSLRSPYTAIGHARVLAMIERTGVTTRVRPVMPMMMRGVPAPREKQRYIMADSGREGRACGSPMQRIVDPFGEPVKRAFALFPGALAQGKSMEFVTAYLQAAWVDGVDITRERGLARVAQSAGLDLATLRSDAGSADWQALLEENLQAMFTHNLWGVPSFRVTGGAASADFACWGQDRIWRVEAEIAARRR
ncbi:MAG: DsbA family protein [Pseudomonadota bacterium]